MSKVEVHHIPPTHHSWVSGNTGFVITTDASSAPRGKRALCPSLGASPVGPRGGNPCLNPRHGDAVDQTQRELSRQHDSMEGLAYKPSPFPADNLKNKLPITSLWDHTSFLPSSHFLSLFPCYLLFCCFCCFLTYRNSYECKNILQQSLHFLLSLRGKIYFPWRVLFIPVAENT